jgi:hypothetical protein
MHTSDCGARFKQGRQGKDADRKYWARGRQKKRVGYRLEIEDNTGKIQKRLQAELCREFRQDKGQVADKNKRGGWRLEIEDNAGKIQKRLQAELYRVSRLDKGQVADKKKRGGWRLEIEAADLRWRLQT